MKVGRPLKFESVEELDSLIEKYFIHCETTEEIPDVEGLALFLDTTRDLLWDYQKIEMFSDTIKRAKNRLFANKKQLAMKGKMPPAIFIFDSINNHGYSNKQEFDHTTKGESIKPVNLSHLTYEQLKQLADSGGDSKPSKD